MAIDQILRLAAVPLLLLVGCSADPVTPGNDTGEKPPPGEDPLENDLIVRVETLDPSGRPATAFPFGENIHFRIAIVNETGEDQPWSYSYATAPADVYVGSVGGEGTTFMGNTLRGSQWTCEPDSGVLEAGDSLTYRISWFDNPRNIVLPPGEYTSKADLTFLFDRVEPDREWISFAVSPSARGDEHIFSVYQFPAMGFQPPLGKFLWAHVIRTEAPGKDRHVLYGARVVGYDGDETCWGVQWAYPLTEAVTPLILSEAQADTLLQLIADFPDDALPEINYACDPGWISFYILGGNIRRVGNCVSGPPEYREHMNDLGEFIETLAPHAGGLTGARPPRDPLE